MRRRFKRKGIKAAKYAAYIISIISICYMISAEVCAPTNVILTKSML
jgi:hypothetical protein